MGCPYAPKSPMPSSCPSVTAHSASCSRHSAPCSRHSASCSLQTRRARRPNCSACWMAAAAWVWPTGRRRDGSALYPVCRRSFWHRRRDWLRRVHGGPKRGWVNYSVTASRHWRSAVSVRALSPQYGCLVRVISGLVRAGLNDMAGAERIAAATVPKRLDHARRQLQRCAGRNLRDPVRVPRSCRGESVSQRGIFLSLLHSSLHRGHSSLSVDARHKPDMTDDREDAEADVERIFAAAVMAAPGLTSVTEVTAVRVRRTTASLGHHRARFASVARSPGGLSGYGDHVA